MKILGKKMIVLFKSAICNLNFAFYPAEAGLSGFPGD